MAATPPTGKYMLWVTIEAKGPAEADKIIEMLKKVAKRANSNEEPNCHGYIPGRSVDNPNTIIVFEQYDNKGSNVANKEHHAGQDFQALMAQAKDLTNKVDMKFYDYV
ncbi:hypothetical protein NDA11_000194 [Ustilago hordei]|nr:uncharacterized protein UHO2_06292 [Ustilago hordei]KAJ1038502.1 hypothetical protein NDA10_005375 [Ustilago hordei]KAJ1570431.1 hypothetical protein NDA15_005901 [Ustilago hordei]KAJ1575856.1 hypothetical protein NDA11_000194 [Ustilago hordei]KAJ1604213.1 hypothetical protein NDA14_005651 [Ustilago hordei]UTT87833.1 hypothetical protein NDA17_003330 [Ustilago hordei]